MSKKIVLYISPNGYIGGAERFVINCANEHNKNIFIHPIILFLNDGEAVTECKKLQIEHYVLKTKFKFRNPIKLLKALWEIRKTFILIKPEIVHATMPYAHILTSLASFSLPIKKVWFQHGPVGGLLDKIANFFKVNVIMYNSHYLMQEHHRTSGLPKTVHGEEIIYLGVNNPHTQNNLFSKNNIIIGSSGRITHWKGFHTMLKALESLKQDLPELKFKFNLAGSAKTDHDKLYEQELKNLVNSSDLKDSIQFLSHINNMQDFYNQIDIFVHASTIPEPFGLVVAEAMSHGCFVIGSNLGGVTDILINDQTGYTYNPTTPDSHLALKEQIKKALYDKKRCQSIALNGQNLIHTKYNLNKMIWQIEDIYKKLLN